MRRATRQPRTTARLARARRGPGGRGHAAAGTRAEETRRDEAGVIPLTPELLAELAERASRNGLPAAGARSCARPATARGRSACEGTSRPAATTGAGARCGRPITEPDGVLRKACGNRREAVCPACAERYRQDAYHLIAAGLRGGKGVPGLDRRAPGRVRDADRAELRACALAAARPGRSAAALPAAARRSGLPARQPALVRRDSRRGRPVPRRAAVPRVLRPRGRDRLEQPARRAVAAHDDLPAAHDGVADRDRTQERLARARALLLRQGRRVPAPRPRAPARPDPARPGDAGLPRRRAPPAPARASTSSCSNAPCADRRRRQRAAARTSSARGRVRWGGEVDVRRLDDGQVRGELAGYLAKYATKSTELAGGVLHRVSEHEVDELPVSDHVRAYLRAGVQARRRARARRPALRRAPRTRSATAATA